MKKYEAHDFLSNSIDMIIVRRVKTCADKPRLMKIEKWEKKEKRKKRETTKEKPKHPLQFMMLDDEILKCK